MIAVISFDLMIGLYKQWDTEDWRLQKDLKIRHFKYHKAYVSLASFWQSTFRKLVLVVSKDELNLTHHE